MAALSCRRALDLAVVQGGCRQVDALARQFGVDLKNLSELNEYIVQHLRESIVVIDTSNAIRLINSSAARLLGAVSAVPGVPLSEASAALADYIAKWRTDAAPTSHAELTLVTEGNSVRIKAHLAPLGKDGQRDGPILVFLEDASHINERVWAREILK